MTTSTASTNHNESAPAELSVDLTRSQDGDGNTDPQDWAGADLPGPQPGRRRRFTSEEKRQFIKQAMAPGESMSSVGRRHGLSVSLLFRWRRQLESGSRNAAANGDGSGPKNEARELRDRVRELERLLGRKTLEAELLQQELSRLGHNPGAALSALDADPAPEARR